MARSQHIYIGDTAKPRPKSQPPVQVVEQAKGENINTKFVIVHKHHYVVVPYPVYELRYIQVPMQATEFASSPNLPAPPDEAEQTTANMGTDPLQDNMPRQGLANPHADLLVERLLLHLCDEEKEETNFKQGIGEEQTPRGGGIPTKPVASKVTTSSGDPFVERLPLHLCGEEKEGTNHIKQGIAEVQIPRGGGVESPSNQ